MDNPARVDSPPHILIPELTSDELQGLKDYWEVYELHHDEITTALMNVTDDHPEFNFILQKRSFPQAGLSQVPELELQRRAILEGEWEPYLNRLHIQGLLYAQSSLKFHGWFEFTSVIRQHMLPHLFETYGKSSKRLFSAMSGMDRFMDIVMGVICESYLSTKEKLILQQKEFIQESQGQLAGIINSAMDAIITINENQRILIFNPAAEMMFGYSADEVRGEPLTMLIPDRLRQKHEADVHSFGQTSVTKRAMGRLGMVFGMRASGEEFPLEASISQIEVGGQKNYTAILRDITENVRAREALQESEEKLRLFIEHAPASLAMFDREMRYLAVSRRWLTDYSLGDQDVRGILHYEIFPEIPERWKKIHRRGMAGETINADEDEFVRLDGSVQWLHWEVLPWHTADGEIGGIVIFTEDITERKRAVDDLRELKDDLEQRVMHRTAQLEAANKELKAFSYSVSHDLRAPLRSIDGFSQALLEDYLDKLPEDGQDYLNRIRAAAQRMAQLIDDILKLSRVNQSSMEHGLVDLSALASEIADALHQEEPERKAAFSIMPGLHAKADKRLMKIVLDNLLGNAWKFTSKNDKYALIEFGAEEVELGRAFYVRDNGSGFDMTYADKLFGAFQRLHSTNDFPGTGIGLATVQRIIHRHGGRVWAEGELNWGATFYFTL